jgi:hypothetical protein
MSASDLTENHRNTLYHLERHPTSHNLEWHDVKALLAEVGTVTDEHDGKVKVSLGGKTLFITPPRHKDIDEDTVLELRRMLHAAGYHTDEK